MLFLLLQRRDRNFISSLIVKHVIFPRSGWGLVTEGRVALVHKVLTSHAKNTCIKYPVK